MTNILSVKLIINYLTSDMKSIVGSELLILRPRGILFVTVCYATVLRQDYI